MITNYKYSENKIDWVLVLLLFLLLGLGFMNLYSSDYVEYDKRDFFQTDYGKQLIWIIVTIVFAIIIFFTETVFFTISANLIYIIIIGLLVLVLIVGKTVNGSKSWMGIGGLGLQPAEFAKLAISLFLARYISNKKIDLSDLNIKNLFNLLVFIVIPIFFILLQPDFGTVLSFTALLIVFYRFGISSLIPIYIFIMFLVFVFSIKISFLYIFLTLSAIGFLFFMISLNNKKLFIRIILISIIVLVLVFVGSKFLKYSQDKILFYTAIIVSLYSLILTLMKRQNKATLVVFFYFSSLVTLYASDLMLHKVLKQHHRNRIEVLFNEKIDPQGIGYNLRQSKIAIASGGFWGKGYLRGTQTKLNFVPAHNTDFIFCTLVEEFGWFGSFVLFVLYFVLIYRILQRAEQQVSMFSRVYGYCVASFFIVHIILNIAMVIGLFPVIGIPLPFFSYGGSAILSFSIMLLIFIKLDSERNLNL